ncbi:DJ-1 family protein [Candidatus Marinamargulisbacteria bacterium SCGC AG-439-L15]|nr:DJ-1 family protein [Candidatus Marinamargulisbacteria bacterium SCGC AG-439-L15]
MTTALIILANGFEDIEALTIIDILRRAGIQVTTAGLGGVQIDSAHNVTIHADQVLETMDETTFDAIVLPGGEPGTTNMDNSSQLKSLLKQYAEEGKLVAAICAAPHILDSVGLLNGKKATSYPAYKDKMLNCNYSEDSVVIDSNIITSRGPGTAMAFSYAIVDHLKSPEHSQELKTGMLYA